MFRTGNTGTRPKSSAARERHCTTPVDPNRYNTISFKFSTRLFQVISMSGSSVLKKERNLLLQFLVHFFQSSPGRIAHLDKILSRIYEFAAFHISDIPLLCQFSKENLRYGGTKNDQLGIIHSGDLAYILHSLISKEQRNGAMVYLTLSASGWSILFKAYTVGNFSSTNALTTFSIVSSDHCSRGSFSPNLSRTRVTSCAVLP